MRPDWTNVRGFPAENRTGLPGNTPSEGACSGRKGRKREMGRTPRPRAFAATARLRRQRRSGSWTKTILLMGWERWDCRPKPCLGLCPKPHQGPVPGPFIASRCIKPPRAFAATARLRRQRRSGSWTENDSLYGAGTLGLPSQTLPGAPPRTPQGALPLDPSSLRADLPAFTCPMAFFPACRPCAGRSPGFCPSYP